MSCKLNLEDGNFVVAIVGLIIALVALVVSCQANRISEANQKKVERLECYDKVSEKINSLIGPYGEAIDNATRIHNYILKKLDVSTLHSDFQLKASEILSLKKSVLNTVHKFDFKCSEKATAVLQDIDNLSMLRVAKDYYEDFGGFNSVTQDKHIQNFNWLLNSDVADECCPN